MSGPNRELAKHIWDDARKGAQQLREFGDPDLAAAVERVMRECQTRGSLLTQERKRQKQFRDDMRRLIDALTAKVNLALMTMKEGKQP